MSMNESPSAAHDSHNIIPSTRQSSRSQFAPDLEALDHRLKHLSDEVLPLNPFLLTLPTNAPFRLGNRFVDNWAIGRDGPFSPEEQQLQYMTFLTHHDGDSLLVAVGDWSDESGRMMADRTGQSTADHTREGGAKKKISLKDYKNQRNSGVSVSPADDGVGSRGDSKVANTLDGQRAFQSDGAKESGRAGPHHAQSITRSGPLHEKGAKKRPSEADREHSKPQGMKISTAHSPKKPRLSPEKDIRRVSTPTKSHSPRLPALLSPTLPPTSSGPRLPRLLSPTLPPDIEKDLASLGERSPLPSVSPNRDMAGKLKREDAAHSKVPSAPNAGSSTSLQPKDAVYSRDHLKDNRALDIKVQSRASAIPRLIVKLRYGKLNRKRVEALLRFSGKRKSHRSESPLEQDSGRDGGATCGNSSSGRRRNKSNHETGETSAHLDSRAKERKDSSETPRTPVSHPFLGPSLSAAHDKPKSTSLTPVKDTRGSSTHRSDLVESGSHTALSPSRPDARSRNNPVRAWRDEFQRFSNIGRELKHASERHYANSEEKLAAVTSIEAVFCFILAFVVDDQVRTLSRGNGDSSNWQSILAYWSLVMKRNAPYPPLHSLCLVLGAVSYDAIHALDLEKLANGPLPAENTPVPTPGSDGNTVLSDESKKSRKEFQELRKRLLDFYKESQKLWLEGTRGLSEEVLSHEFPTTWSQRSRNYLERGRQQLRVGEYSGAYFLPLGGTAAPIEVVRFGWSLLKEWCAKEGVNWHGRLGL